jgi:hypothetical protein
MPAMSANAVCLRRQHCSPINPPIMCFVKRPHKHKTTNGPLGLGGGGNIGPYFSAILTDPFIGDEHLTPHLLMPPFSSHTHILRLCIKPGNPPCQCVCSVNKRMREQRNEGMAERGSDWNATTSALFKKNLVQF